eukprot:Skav212295  [mRNA]  locus=scaffold732:580975:584797:- [translate_table: standard]
MLSTRTVDLWAFKDAEEFEKATDCNALNGAQSFVLAHLAFLPLALSVSTWAHQLMKHRAESRFRESKSETQLNAASALLNLTCDAVVELGEDLRLLSHSGSLATLLMRNRAGATLKGVKFTDLVVPSDVDRVTQILETRGDGSAAAHHFRTNLSDSYESKFCAEVFQVKFTMASGEKCHIAGLRDVTDVHPLEDRFTHHLSDGLEKTLSDEFNETESVSGLSRHPLSNRSSVVMTSPTSSLQLAEENVVSNKEVFMEIDVDNEFVKSATAPFAELVGRSLREVTFSPFALQTCKRLCRDAAAIDANDEATRADSALLSAEVVVDVEPGGTRWKK